MGCKFRPIEDIAGDDSIGVGDVFVLRELPSGSNGRKTVDQPVYCGVMDKYEVPDNPPGGLEAGQDFYGVRVYHFNEEGRFRAHGRSVFNHPDRGLLIPFDTNQKYEYAPVG